MAANVNNDTSCWKVPEVRKHHEQQKVCFSRPKYRDGRRAKAVKVYTINLESRYVMIQGVPAIGVMEELIQLCALYGVVEEYRPLDEYPAEEFTEVYLVKFQKLTSARIAKRNIDEKSFYGGVLHVCYVPEYESVEDTKFKLQDRRRYVQRMARCKATKIVDATAHQESSNAETSSSTSLSTHFTRKERRVENDTSPETTNIDIRSGFPLLPSPPQEYDPHNHVQKPCTLIEDRMGTLHDAIPETEHDKTGISSNKVRDSELRLPPHPGSAVRLLPRAAHMERRKRFKVEEAVQHSVPVSAEDQPLIGPKLPEPPKPDVYEKSFNTTMNLIRNTMNQVRSLPDVKPAEKKIKPRRRI